MSESVHAPHPVEAGDVIVTAAGSPHAAWNAGDDRVHVLADSRPALRTEIAFEALAGPAQDGKITAAGVPKNPLQAAVILRHFQDEIYFVRPPRAVQRGIFGRLAALGRMLGYRAEYPYPDASRNRPSRFDVLQNNQRDQQHNVGRSHAKTGTTDGGIARRLGRRSGRHGAGGWGLAPEDPALKQRKLEWVRAAGLHIMGRATYEEMAEVWPTSESDYAPPMNEIPKVVFSKTLERAEWADSRIARGDLAAEIDELKREPGKHMIVHGGASFVQSLSRLGLVDEYRLSFNRWHWGTG